MSNVTNSYRQAITTKYYGPTNTKGSRVKATAEAGSVWMSWNYALNADQNHDAACQALLEKLGWSGEWKGGSVNGGYVYVYVNIR